MLITSAAEPGGSQFKDLKCIVGMTYSPRTNWHAQLIVQRGWKIISFKITFMSNLRKYDSLGPWVQQAALILFILYKRTKGKRVIE